MSVRRPLPRPLWAGAIAAALVLTGCSDAGQSATNTADNSATATEEPKKADQEALANVVVSDLVRGTAPTVTFPEKPFSVSQTTIKVLEEGDGDVVSQNATVLVDYHGVNGRTGESFDSSFAETNPASFSLNGVIKGFKKSIAGQKIGSKVLVAVPPKDGYGERGTGDGRIGPKDTIVFAIIIHDPAK